MLYGAVGILVYCLAVVCFVRIMNRAGFGILGWAALFPPAIPVLILVLAFWEWPISKWPDIRMPP